MQKGFKNGKVAGCFSVPLYCVTANKRGTNYYLCVGTVGHSMDIPQTFQSKVQYWIEGGVYSVSEHMDIHKQKYMTETSICPTFNWLSN